MPDEYRFATPQAARKWLRDNRAAIQEARGVTYRYGDDCDGLTALTVTSLPGMTPKPAFGWYLDADDRPCYLAGDTTGYRGPYRVRLIANYMNLTPGELARKYRRPEVLV